MLPNKFVGVVLVLPAQMPRLVKQYGRAFGIVNGIGKKIRIDGYDLKRKIGSRIRIFLRDGGIQPVIFASENREVLEQEYLIRKTAFVQNGDRLSGLISLIGRKRFGGPNKREIEPENHN